MSYVEFRDVKKVYKTGEVEINALRDVDFEIEKGESEPPVRARLLS